MVKGFRIESDRLWLRPFVLDDVDALHKVMSDAELMRYYPHPFSKAETKEWIEWNIGRYERDGFGLWAMVLSSTGELIGDCGLVMQEVDGEPDVEIGWHVRADMCNRGLATEAGVASRDYGFEKLGLPRLIALVRPENMPSCRVAEKVGMTVERITIRGPGWNHRVYSMQNPSVKASL